MDKKSQNKKRTFCVSPKTDKLLENLKEHIEVSYSVVIKQALELLAKQEGVSND